jgi:thiamine biosynthesis lipoprotein
MTTLSRRRFISITACAAGLPIAGAARAQTPAVTWQGQAMGAAATLRIYHPDELAARRLVVQALTEVRRLEGIFSLYRESSALVSLNRQGALAAPPPELVDVLGHCRRYWLLTGGAFDPTVQALWVLYRDHFSRENFDPAGPSEDNLREALSRVGFDGVVFDRTRVSLPRRDMALTLNGIAQGYLTDRVVDVLRAGGIESSLVDMGEPRALGHAPLGVPWRIGIGTPPEALSQAIEVAEGAVATSSGEGFQFDAQGRFTHLLDPRTGRSPLLYRAVTVLHPSAASADALSTAFSFLQLEEIEATLRAMSEGEVRLITATGEKHVLRA